MNSEMLCAKQAREITLEVLEKEIKTAASEGKTYYYTTYPLSPAMINVLETLGYICYTFGVATKYTKVTW